MRRVKLTVFAVALFSLLVFLFLGAVSFESATSLSTVNQQSILRALMDPIRPEQGSNETIRQHLEDHELLSTGAFFAFVLADDGKTVFLDGEAPTEDQQALIDHITENRHLEPHQMVFDGSETTFVWINAPKSGPEGRLYLAYQRPIDTLVSRFKLYFVPAVIAILVVVWISVWSGLIARRAILAHEKQKELEFEVVRQEEASRVKSAFLANMNHELRTPLNAIIGFSQMMQMQLLGPIGHVKYGEYVGNILSASAHLRKLIGNILDISKIEAGEEVLEEEVVCLRDVMQECLSMTEAEFKAKNQTVDAKLGINTPCLMADRLKIRQILLNLLTNANKFTPEGGTITALVGTTPEGGLRVSIEDTGKGIAAEELEIVLQPFKRSQDRADTAKDGFGLGLPLSAALAELHGAKFDLQSELGVGTSVRVTFPRERLVAEATLAADTA